MVGVPSLGGQFRAPHRDTYASKGRTGHWASSSCGDSSVDVGKCRAAGGALREATISRKAL